VNLLHVIPSVNPSVGGTIEAVRQLGCILVSKGHRVEIVSLDSPGAACTECPLPVYPLGPAKLKYGFSDRLIPWLRQNRSRYDAVIVHGIWQFHSFASWRALRNSSTPYVVYPHGMLDPWFKARYPLKHLKKWMYWPWAEYRVLRDAQAVLFTCEQERIGARRSFLFYRCNEVVVNCGTEKPKGNPGLQLQEFLDRYPRLREKKIVLFMGRIHPKKGCDLLIEAFAKVLGGHPEWSLVIAGPDQVGWQEKLSRQAERLGVASRITWTGMLTGTLKWGAFRAAEMFVLPSHQENFGIAVAEALAARVPALISDKVNIWREIEREEAGIVATDNFRGSCELLQSYLEMSEGQRFAMRQRAYQCFERRFEIGQAAERLQLVLESITGTN
jgi:glycosyltransferase involved in cell wall biosynthesis